MVVGLEVGGYFILFPFEGMMTSSNFTFERVDMLQPPPEGSATLFDYCLGCFHDSGISFLSVAALRW